MNAIAHCLCDQYRQMHIYIYTYTHTHIQMYSLSNFIFLFPQRASNAFLMMNPKNLGQTHPFCMFIAVKGV